MIQKEYVLCKACPLLPGSLSSPHLHHLTVTCVLGVNRSRDKTCIYKHVCVHILCCTYIAHIVLYLFSFTTVFWRFFLITNRATAFFLNNCLVFLSVAVLKFMYSVRYWWIFKLFSYILLLLQCCSYNVAVQTL